MLEGTGIQVVCVCVCLFVCLNISSNQFGVEVFIHWGII